MNALNSYKMEIDEVGERYIAPCFVNGLEAYDGEINLAFNENMISNEYVLKLCLDHEVKKGQKLVKKELIVALRGELYFVKFIINPEEDDVELGVILGRSFMRLAKGIVDFGNGVITVYPEPDLFKDDSKKTEKSPDDWDKLLDFNFDDVPKFGEELPPFVCKMGKGNQEAEKEALAIRISQKFALLEEKRYVIETMAYHDKYKKVLDEIWKDKVELDGKIVKEEEEVIKKFKGEALKEKDDPGAFIFPIRLEGKDIPIDRDAPIVVGRGFLYTMGSILNTPEKLFSTFDGVCHQTFRVARFDVLRTAESDSDDEEEYQIKRNKFGAPMYGPKPTPYLNFSFLGSLPVPLKQVNWKPDYKGCYTKEEEATRQWRTKIRLTDPYRNIYLQGFTTKKIDQKLSKYHKLWEHTMMKHDHQETSALDNMKQWKKCCIHKFITCFYYGEDATRMLRCDGEIDDMLRIRLLEAESNEEIFTSVAWIRAININEPIYAKLCHKFYSTYEFDEVCASNELQTKKIIKFRRGGRAYSLTLLEFARRLGLYHADELDEDGFNVYFEGGDYTLKLTRETNFDGCNYDQNDLTYLETCDKERLEKEMAPKRKVKFVVVIARKSRVLTYDVLRSLSAPVYCRYLGTTTLRELIDFESRPIPEDPQPGVPRVGIPRPPRASMQDLYDRMGRMEIRQEAIERMEYMQSYHWDRYQGVFEHMVGVYSVPLQGAYNLPGYAQPQYDQYYQQYPPPQPQYLQYQQQQNDNE
ncbi:hypothetical protein Tco_0604308 [Tanacetum coccineum]